MGTDPADAFTVADMQDCFAPADRCWCGWSAHTPSPFSPRYHCCARCGTHYSAQRIRPEAVARFYGFQSYWQERNRLKQHEKFEDRAALFTRQGRVAKWLSVIDRNHPGQPGLVCEIGCAEGSFLAALRERGWTTFGVEPDAATAAATRSRTGLDIRAGAFPCPLELPPLDAVVALDVLEHAADPRAFLEAVRRLLKPEGFFFFQSPILGSDPAGFASLNNRAFDAQEHAFIFTRDSVADLLAAAGFAVVENSDAWGIAHEIVVARPLPAPAAGLRPLANLAEMLSPDFANFAEQLHAFAQQHGLAAYDRSPRTWELPRLWHAGLATMDWKGKHLVDLGSEISPWPWWIAKQGAKVTLVEIRRDWVSLWERLRHELDVQVEWVFTESDAIPLPTGCADVVSSVSVIEHQQDKARAMAELERVLRPGGTLALSCDIFEPGLGMTYPEWNGRALGAAEFEDLLARHSSLHGTRPASTWNWPDVQPFRTWFRRTAPHHNYAMAAVVLSKQAPAAPVPSVAARHAVLISQPDDVAGTWAAARWVEAWVAGEPHRRFFWIIPPSETARLLEFLPHASLLACDTSVAPRVAARTLVTQPDAGPVLLTCPICHDSDWTEETHRQLLWWRDFIAELGAELALVPSGSPSWVAAISVAASGASRRIGDTLPPDTSALLQHAVAATTLTRPPFSETLTGGPESVAQAQARGFLAAGAAKPATVQARLGRTGPVLLLTAGLDPCWPASHWEALAANLRAHGITVEVCDRDACRDVPIARLRAASAAICAEGPLAQLAATLGLPIVVISGGAEPGRWISEHSNVKTIQGLPPCRGCGRDCLLSQPVCVNAITVETVAAAVEALLGTGDASPVAVDIPLPPEVAADQLHAVACRRLRHLVGARHAAERRLADCERELAEAELAQQALRAENLRLGQELLRVGDECQHRLEHIHAVEARLATCEQNCASRLEHIHAIEARLATSERENASRLEHIHRIEAKLATSEQNCASRLEHIHRIEAKLTTSERDNASRLEHIHALETKLATSERDGAARLEHIHTLETKLTESDADRDARLRHIHLLESRLLAQAGSPPAAPDTPSA